MTKVKQSKQDLYKHLNENLNFLKGSAAAFDAGFVGEAKRMAVTIRVLLHDTKNSKSLLGLLGLKDKTRYLDTSPDLNKKNMMSHTGLVHTRATDQGVSYYAPLSNGIPDNKPKYIRFPDWWNKVVIKDQKKNTFKRRELVLTLANQDGGAHVDPELNEGYSNLTRNNSVGWFVGDGTRTTPLEDIELHSVRQITHELILTIERKLNAQN